MCAIAVRNNENILLAQFPRRKGRRGGSYGPNTAVVGVTPLMASFTQTALQTPGSFNNPSRDFALQSDKIKTFES